MKEQTWQLNTHPSYKFYGVLIGLSFLILYFPYIFIPFYSESVKIFVLKIYENIGLMTFLVYIWISLLFGSVIYIICGSYSANFTLNSYGLLKVSYSSNIRKNIKIEFNLSNTEIKLYRYFFAGTGTLGTIVQLNNGKNKIRIGAKGVDPMYFTKKEIKNKSSIQFYTTDYRFKSFIAAIKQYQPGLVDSVKSDLLIKLEKRSAHKLFIILMFIVILASGQFFAFFIRDFLGLSDNRTGLFVVIYYILAIVVIILVVNLKKPKEYQIAKEGDWLKLINNKGVIASGNISSLKFVLYNQYGKFGVFNSAHTGVSIKILFPRKTIHVLTLDPLVIWKDNFKNKHFLPNYSITKMNLLKLVNALGIKENLLKI